MHVTDNTRLSEAMIPVPLKVLEEIRLRAEEAMGAMSWGATSDARYELRGLVNSVNEAIRGAK